MASVEPLPQLLKRLERYINNLPSIRRRNTLPRSQQALMNDIANTIEMARKQAEFSLGDEDEVAQSLGFKLAHKQLEQVRASMLKASEYDLLTPVDISHLSAMVDVSLEQLQQILKR